MLVLSAPFGENSNRFFQHVHLDAFCRSHDIEFVNPFLSGYSGIFPNIAGTDFPNHRFSRLRRLLSKNFKSDAEENKAWILSRSSDTCYVKGWGFRAYDEVVAGRAYYKSLFTPACADEVQTFMNEMKSDGAVLSVHLRRGDYRRWQNGRFYYADVQYSEIIRRVLATNANIGSVQLFSNEPIDVSSFLSLGVKIVAASTTWYEEQWKMALSDYIVGPPSTFSGWASYVGSVPLWHVVGSDADVDFSVCNG